MKTALLAVLVAISAHAAETKPLVSKTSGGGFTMAEYVRFETCDIYDSKVIVQHQYGADQGTGLKVVEEKPVKVIGNLRDVVAKAKAERLVEKDNGLCDAPSTTVTMDGGENESELLFTSGGCGSPRKERNGAQSAKLRAIADLYCPKTFDHAGTR